MTALRDARHPTAYALLRDAPLHAELRPVGRLDIDTSGLLLWTTDGAEIQRLTHPKRAVPRTYQAALARAPGPLPADLVLDDGLSPAHRARSCRWRAPMRTRASPSPPRHAALASITITGGAYHEVRRIFAALGSHVLALCRVRFGDIELPRDLAAGEYRLLVTDGTDDRRCTSSWSSRRFTGTRATRGGPAWRRARSCTWSGRSASRSRTRRCAAPGSTTGRGSRPRVWPDWAAFERELPSLGAPYLFTARAPRRFQDVAYPTPAVLIFGRESVGLDPQILARHAARHRRDPDAGSASCARSTCRPRSRWRSTKSAASGAGSTAPARAPD